MKSAGVCSESATGLAQNGVIWSYGGTLPYGQGGIQLVVLFRGYTSWGAQLPKVTIGAYCGTEPK